VDLRTRITSLPSADLLLLYLGIFDYNHEKSILPGLEAISSSIGLFWFETAPFQGRQQAVSSK
jgi:hypothetical protein